MKIMPFFICQNTIKFNRTLEGFSLTLSPILIQYAQNIS